MGTTANKTTRTDIFKIDPTLIEFDNNDNPRKDYGDMDSLISFIRKNGTMGLPEILVRKLKTEDGSEKYQLVHGFRRMNAITSLIAQDVEIARVLCKIVNVSKEEEVLLHITNNSGKPLTIYEEACIYKQLETMGFTQREISDRVGVTVASVSTKLKVASASKKIQEVMSSGIITTTTVLKIMQAHPEDYEDIIIEAMNTMKAYSKTKITDKLIEETITKTKSVRQSKYQKAITLAIAKVAEQDNKEKLAMLHKAEQIIAIMDTYKDDEMIEKLSEVI